MLSKVRCVISPFSFSPASLLTAASDNDSSKNSQVPQYHKNANRDGRVVDPRFLPSAISGGSRFRQIFASPIPGPVYAQPLYFHASSSRKNLVIVVSEQNLVTALDALTGEMIWRQNLGNPVALKQLPCGNINPLGITGTPVIDVRTKRHLVYALSAETGTIRPGWPVDIQATLKSRGIVFHSEFQNQRGALTFLEEKIYIPYGGHFGDCGDYHGWVVGISASDPKQLNSWSTSTRAGGIWAPGGLSSDGTSLFLATGNTKGATTWGGGNAVIRLESGLSFSGKTKDFFAPPDWKNLDANDMDLGGMAPVLFDLAGSNPEHLVFITGKTGVAYLLNREDLGGIGGSLTAQPSLATGWCARQNGRGSPIVTTPDGRSNFIVWSLGAEGDGKLHAFDGETGKALYESASLGLIRRFQTPIAAQGRIYVAADRKLYGFQAQ